MNKYNISKNAIGIRLSPNDEFMFTWDDGTKETSIRVSLHGAKALAETFRNFGYEEEEGSVRFKKGDCPLPTDSCNPSDFKSI